MPDPQQPKRKPSRFPRAVAVAAVFGVIFFAALWYTVFNAVTAALVASGGAGLMIAGGTLSDMFESLLETLANVLLAILGAIAAVLGAILSIFE